MVWKLSDNGSVGEQALTGIAALEHFLRPLACPCARLRVRRIIAFIVAVTLVVVYALRRAGLHDRTMAKAIAFDTHRFVKRLTESGFTETPAEEHVALLNANLATKTDVEALRQETKAGIETLPHETSAAIEAVKADLVK